MKEDISRNMLSAIIKDLDARESKATATIQLLLMNPTAIANHTNILDEVITWSNHGAEAREAKRFLLDKFTTQEDQ
ncbi:MAG: hypothetical protein CMA72_09685 [Euryarchaeota archaeon]|nr:hypothetical protein [Euryarchaeota archaeon]|tara:strand:- start:972 stop:1199 length:228 start_codon:yes stop_codon:yes gene_type:complete